MSDEAAIEREMQRQLRGQMLRYLQNAFGISEVREQLLRKFCAPNRNDEMRFRQELAYVIAKGYVEKTEVGIDALDRRPQVFLKITPRGVDVMTGNLVDEAIGID